MSEEHKALGYRPPPGSLAADAQSAAAKHPEGKASIDPAVLTQAALKDAARISSERRSSSGSPPRMEPQELSQDETRILQSLETKLLDSTKDTISAEAQSVNDKKDSKEAIPSPEATAETTEATTTDQ
ncbi:hypothetical protein MPER_08583 [Moniliophthora perniciosa FA553]|nr:hypothetical protein MPER_08583 [Moniliophthora perniciosa FA553]